VLKALSDSPERTQQELDLQITLGPALIATKGFAALEVEKAYTRAQELVELLDGQGVEVAEDQRFQVLRGLRSFHSLRAELQKGRELSEQLLNLAQNVQDPALLLEAHRALGSTLCDLGEFIDALAHLEQGIAFYNPQQHRFLASLYGMDPRVAGQSQAARVLWCLGYPDQALKRSHEALTQAQELPYSFSLAFALNFATTVHQHRREKQVVQERVEELVKLSSEQEFAQWLAYGTILRGWALVKQERVEEGIARWLATGAELNRPYHLAMLAEVYGKEGPVEKGLDTLADALALVNKTGERWWEAELYRLKGKLLLRWKAKGKGQKAKMESEAEECFQKAINIACRQNAKSFELRAATSLARLWQRQGKKKEAQEVLGPIYHWFTEGFDTKDLQEAKELLEELRLGEAVYK
jgi:predicted ATPase